MGKEHSYFQILRRSWWDFSRADQCDRLSMKCFAFIQTINRQVERL